MTRQEIQEAGASVLLDVLRESNHKHYYVCPACGKAKVYKPSNQRRGDVYGLWRCLSCGQHGDVFNALELQGMTAREAFAWVMERTGNRAGSTTSGNKWVTASEDKRPRRNREPEAAAEPDLTAWRAGCADYCREAAAALPGSPGEEYLRGRGLTVKTLQSNLIGYDRRAMVGGSMSPYGRESVIFPYDGACSYYSARFLKPYTDRAGNLRRFARPPADKAGGQPVFHGKQLWTAADAVFIVESEIDCLSVVQAAGLLDRSIGCVACGGGNNIDALVSGLRQRPARARLLIAFDDDRESAAGWLDSLRLSKRLTAIGQRHELVIPWRAYAGRNDVNDILREDDGTATLADVIDTVLTEDWFTVAGDSIEAELDRLLSELQEIMS